MLSLTGLTCEGIYRISGVKSKVQTLKESYNKGVPVDLLEHEPNVVASLLKQFLRELPQPVLTTALMPKFEEASSECHSAPTPHLHQLLARPLIVTINRSCRVQILLTEQKVWTLAHTIHKHTHAHVHTHTLTDMHTHAHRHACTYAYTTLTHTHTQAPHTCTHTHTQIHTYTHHTHIHKHMHMHACTHTHACTHAHTHTHTMIYAYSVVTGMVYLGLELGSEPIQKGDISQTGRQCVKLLNTSDL